MRADREYKYFMISLIREIVNKTQQHVVLRETENRLVVLCIHRYSEQTGGEYRVGKTGEDGQKAQISGYKKNKFWRCNVQPGDKVDNVALYANQIRSDQITHSVVSSSLRPHESQHTRPPCPSPTPGVH